MPRIFGGGCRIRQSERTRYNSTAGWACKERSKRGKQEQEDKAKTGFRIGFRPWLALAHHIVVAFVLQRLIARNGG